MDRRIKSGGDESRKCRAATRAQPRRENGILFPLPPIAVRRTASLRSPMRSAWWGGVRGGGTLLVHPPSRLISLL
jgi:hypothetical protein